MPVCEGCDIEMNVIGRADGFSQWLSLDVPLVYPLFLPNKTVD
ncbi:hypothetical protein [Bartonella queenslandensis]|nr:hypothetical protein [Bartonella queenslandensis]